MVPRLVDLGLVGRLRRLTDMSRWPSVGFLGDGRPVTAALVWASSWPPGTSNLLDFGQRAKPTHTELACFLV